MALEESANPSLMGKSLTKFAVLGVPLFPEVSFYYHAMARSFKGWYEFRPIVLLTLLLPAL